MKRILLTITLCLVACGGGEKDVPLKPTYFKDPATKLCFMSYDFGYPSGVLTNVPCTPEVEK